MNNKTLSIGAGLGGLCYWNTKRVSRARTQAAADQAGFGKLVPAQPPATSTLRTCMLTLGKSWYGRVRKSPLSVRELADPGCFELVRVVAGQSANEYRHLFSASIDPQWNVKVLSAPAALTPINADVVLQSAVIDERDYLPAAIVSAVMVKALRQWAATLLKDDGGLWFIPGCYMDQYRAFASHIAGKGDGPQFKLTQFEIASDPDTVKHVLTELRTEIRTGIEEIMADVMQAEGGLRDRSIAIRQKKADEFLAKVQLYEQFTGKTLSDLTDVVTQAKQALAMNRLLSASV